MKIMNNFAQMQIKDNFIKLLEIRKEDSLYKILSYVKNLLRKDGLLTVDMEIVDCIHNQKHDFSHINNCKYKLVFDRYQRVKVSELKKYINNLKNCASNYKCLEHKTPNFIWDNQNWLILVDLNWLFNEYLKDEEYCIIYFIDKEETFKENGW